MLFSSMTFLLVFLPVVLMAYFAVPQKHRAARNMVLLAFSLVFFAWGEPFYIFLLLATIMVTYTLSHEVSRNNKNALIVAIAVNLLPLLIFKYTNFIIENINLIPGLAIPFVKNLTMPIGISFYTFQSLTYLIDLYKGKVRLQKNPLYICLYIFLFPQLVAGPIVRYETIEDSLDNRVENWDDFTAGFNRFIAGLAKKVIIANQTGRVATIITAQMADSPESIGSSFLWLAVFAYTLQIYFDFSGYSDMVLGLGRMFGFKFNENFDYPYVSRSVTEFWRRWHISMSSFFRDYIYIPLGGNRVSTGRWLFNIMFVWFVTGFWHGASWNYIIWGLYYGVMLIIEKFFLKKILDKIPSVASWAYTFLMTMVGWVFFMTPTNNPGKLFGMLGQMFSFASAAEAPATLRSLELQPYLPYLIVGFICSFPILGLIKKSLEKRENASLIATNISVILLYGVSMLYLISESFNPFIYFIF